MLLNFTQIRDLDLGKMIGNTEMCWGLYILKITYNPERQPQSIIGEKLSFSTSISNNNGEIML